MPCKYGKPRGTFSKFVTQEGLKCDHVREILMKNKDVDTTALVVCQNSFPIEYEIVKRNALLSVLSKSQFLLS